MKYEKYECDDDCFNCKWPDCIKDGISPKERQQSKDMDRRIEASGGNFRGIVRHRKSIKR